MNSKFLTPTLVGVVLLASGCESPAPEGLTAPQPIQASEAPGLAESFAYVTHRGGTVSVIGTASNTVVASIRTATSPFDVASTPDGAFVYATNSARGPVSVISTGRNKVVASIPMGGPTGVAITPDGDFAYVGDFRDRTVVVVETATNTAVDTVFLGFLFHPIDLAITPNGAFVYVTSRAGSSGQFPGGVSVIATATNTVVAAPRVGFEPRGIAITPDGAFAYVTNGRSHTVSVISTATNTVAATIPVGRFPAGIAITPDGAFAYVADVNSSRLSVISTASNTVVTTIPMDQPVGVAITHDGAFVYATNVGASTVSVVATATNTIVATVTGLNTIPEAITITPPILPLPNTPPVADAGSDQSIILGQTVQLDGSGSSDPDDDPITYDWQVAAKPAGSTAQLSGATTARPTLTPDVAGSYAIRLVVNDGLEDSDPDVVTINVQTPAEAAGGIIDQVDDLVAGGVLNDGQGNALGAKLEAAIAQLDRDNTTPAINQLGAFINQVSALVNAGVLSPSEGQLLIDAAQTIIDVLSG